MPDAAAGPDPVVHLTSLWLRPFSRLGSIDSEVPSSMPTLSTFESEKVGVPQFAASRENA